MRRLSLAVVLLLPMLAGGCGGDGAGGPGNGWPSDRTFWSTAVTGPTLVPGTRIELRFFDDGRVSAQAGCNHLGGNGSIEDGALVVSDFSTTEMGCDEPRHSQDQWLSAFLTRKPLFVLNGDQLVLNGGEIKIEMIDRKVADPDRSLYGVRWELESILSKDTASSVPAGAAAHVEFTQAGRVTASAGCNSIGGGAEASGDKIAFSDLETTLIGCPEPQRTVETVLLRVLKDKVTFKIDGQTLTLTHPSGDGLQFRAPN
jgi:heat shock protein HslJ